MTIKDTDMVMTYSKCQEEHAKIDTKSRWVIGLLFSLIIFIAGFLGSCSSNLYSKIETHSVQIGQHDVKIDNLENTIKSINDKLDIIIVKLADKAKTN